MSVIVMGIEMPECCQDCEGHLVGEWNEYDEMCDTCHFVLSEHPWEPKHKEIDGIDTSKSIPDWCPLLPLPEKHGRIVDVGPLEVVAYNLKDHKGESFDDGVGFILEKLDALPTIVEAEGE